MTANTVTKLYDRLSPEERFRLILAAGGRDDEAERDRIVRASGKVHLSFPDYFAFSQAISDASIMSFIDVLDSAGRYLEMFARADQDDPYDTDRTEKERWADTTMPVEEADDEGEGEGDPGDDEADADDIEDVENEVGGFNDRLLQIALAHGYMLHCKAEGWKHFCTEHNLPQLLLWQELPGFDHVQSACKLAEQAAFTEEGFLKWLNAKRKPGDPILTDSPITIAEAADAYEQVFRNRVQWWSGDGPR